ncbi:ankyrin [Aspergillus heteromorphus CBS 117.55]|uniref:Ankyrin n=1 Tax=Aspergillus heteromorphus CBS 117.55 TaxID=1448321 RepID=A0A317WM63_9EURO|nr:ankyrin [Aspergillus heteromorphus CBS 117.55]PWY87423.1 ankyrin [Aspergillus heteromorphus CBS 117.55]
MPPRPLDYNVWQYGTGIGNMPLELCEHLSECKGVAARVHMFVQPNNGQSFHQILSTQARVRGIPRIPVGCLFEYDYDDSKSIICGNHQQLERDLQSGMNPNVTTEAGITLLSLAVGRGEAECARVLLEYGADPNLRGDWQIALPLDYTSPIHPLPARMTIQQLLLHGARFQYPSVFAAICSINDTRYVRQAVDNGTNLAAMCFPDGNTALHFAARAYSDRPDIADTVAELVPALANSRNDRDETPLHLAVTPALQDAMLRAGANPNVRDRDGDTPVHLAIRSQTIDLIRPLLNSRRTDIEGMQNDACEGPGGLLPA